MAVAKIRDDYSLPQIKANMARFGLAGLEEDKLGVAIDDMLNAASYYETWRTKGLGIRGGLMLVLGSVVKETA